MWTHTGQGVQEETVLSRPIQSGEDGALNKSTTDSTEGDTFLSRPTGSRGGWFPLQGH